MNRLYWSKETIELILANTEGLLKINKLIEKGEWGEDNAEFDLNQRTDYYFSVVEYIFRRMYERRLHFSYKDNMRILEFAYLIRLPNLVALCMRNFRPEIAGFNHYKIDQINDAVEFGIDQEHEMFLFYLIYAKLLTHREINWILQVAIEKEWTSIMYLVLKMYKGEKLVYNEKIIGYALKIGVPALIFYYTSITNQKHVNPAFDDKFDCLPEDLYLQVLDYQNRFVITASKEIGKLQTFDTLRRGLFWERTYNSLSYIFNPNFTADDLLNNL